VNPEHLRAFFWLRWRLLVHQLKRGGVVNFVFLAIVLAGAVLLAALLAVGSFLAGLLLLSRAEPPVFLYSLDAVVGVFLFLWILGVITDLQRSEALSLDKFLHLPVSVSGVFVLNYLGSLFSINLLLFVPLMLGLSLGLVFGKGPAMLLMLPLVATFLLMVTALTYQFQGWLASLMVNKRRRRTIVVVVTMVFVLLVQLPNLINMLQPWESKQSAAAQPDAAAQGALDRALAAGKITERHHKELMRKLQEDIKERNRQRADELAHQVQTVNLWLPPGWLPLGAMGLAQGNVLPALLGTLGLALIAAASLWRGYRTTLRLYTGQFTSGKRRAAPATTPVPGVKRPDPFLERRLPWLSEQAAAVTLSSLRSLTRAPEAKMFLLTPIFMLVVFGAMFFRLRVDMPEAARPLMAFAAMAVVLFTTVQLVGNQFGFDRSGFRVFVLCPAHRSDVLLGKNLAVAPLTLTLCIVAAAFIQIVYPMRVDHFFAVLLQLVSMYLLFCLLANTVSILAPMPIAAGTLRPTNTKIIPVLLNMVLIVLLPVVLAPTLLPLAVELGLERLGGVGGLPIYLLLTLVEDAVVIWLYRLVLRWQGEFLQAREQKILEIVAAKAE
jgi:hypothetical protein